MLHGKNKAAGAISKKKQFAFQHKAKIPVTSTINRDLIIMFVLTMTFSWALVLPVSLAWRQVLPGSWPRAWLVWVQPQAWPGQKLLC
jgi:hypothetical protein